MSYTFPPNTHMKYRPDIDGLRAVAVWAVLIFHAFPSEFRSGFIGVDIFFVISGYLISRILFEGIASGSFTFRDFYSRRIRRIFPALILVMTATILAGWVILVADEVIQLGLHIAAGAGFISNLVLWSEAGYFDTASELKPLLHLWSLGIEEQFYIFWPLLLWAAWKIRIPFAVLTITILLGSFFLNIAMISSDPTATFYSPLTRGWELLCGGMLALFSLHAGPRHHDETPWHVHTLSLCGALLLVTSMLVIDESVAFPGWWALLPVLGAVCLIAAGPQGVINRYVLSARPMVWFGLISFPLYLWHWPLLAFGQIVDGQQPKLGYRLIALLLSVLLAWLTVRFVERPLRHGTTRTNIKVGVLCAFLALLGGVGMWIKRIDLRESHTFETRWIERKAYTVGESTKWYRGKNDWLFLGNSYDKTVEKLTGALTPTAETVDAMKADFAAVADRASAYGTEVALLLGPNKTSIYPEYLPNGVKPSKHRYVTSFLTALKNVPGLAVYDPSASLREAKSSDQLLYYRTDTHWNSKGAYLAFSFLQRQLGLPVPDVAFVEATPHAGDLISIGELKNFPLHAGDTWTAVHAILPDFHETIDTSEPSSPFGKVGTVVNNNPLIDEKIWVIGDSFTTALRPYLNTTYREVVYLGHWSDKLKALPRLIDEATDKPARILIIYVERTF